MEKGRVSGLFLSGLSLYFCGPMPAITHESSLDSFHQQISYVLNSYKAHGKQVSDYQNIIIGGLGGSGIGGRLARLAFFTSSPIPIEVFSEYKLPAYAGPKTLLILCSYSGNTEETLQLFAEALSRKSDMICIAAGGRLSELALENGIPLYGVEQGFQPRMTLGYSFSTLLMILSELNGKDMRQALQAASDMLKDNARMKDLAQEIRAYFRRSVDHKFVVISDLAYEAVAWRFCQQVQENAKGEAFVSVLPEGNHNMIESYCEKRDTNFIFLDSGLNPRVTVRFEFLKSLLLDKGNLVYSYPPREFGLNAVFEVIHTLDWLSIYISNDKGADNMDVPIIMQLKAHLDKIPQQQ